MDSELIARISPEHRRRLAWFEEHQGEVSAMPAAGRWLAAGLQAEGDLQARRSAVRAQHQDQPGQPVRGRRAGADAQRRLVAVVSPGERRSGRPRQDVHEPGLDAVHRGPGSRGGAPRAGTGSTRRSQYDALGLALPVQWSNGYFFFESLNPKAVPVIDPVTDVLVATARAEVDQQTANDAEALDDDYEARLRVYRQIVARQGQSGFRAALMEAYQGRCAITGYDAAPALEGAHLRPYRGPESNAVTNGLLLRAHIHTLFDLRLLALDPVTRNIVVSKLLAGTHYEALSTCRLAEPVAAWQRPNQEAVEIIWQSFCEAEDGR